MYADKQYILDLRHRIHEYPEIDFELPKTIALVKAELDKLGIPYTEDFGESSVVAYINPEKENYTIGIRADMDALPIDEKTELPFKSKVAGKMHACGHDAHTAMLLGTAKALKAMEDKIECRVMLVFQPSEEGVRSGASELVNGGLMKHIDVIIGLHIENWLDAGKIGICKGNSMASCRNFKLEFFGRTAHASLPQTGNDAIAAAVGTYNGIQTMLSRKVDPFAKYICSVGKFSGGTTQNVIADYAEMEGTIRTYDLNLDKMLIDGIEDLASKNADSFGCTYKITTKLLDAVVYNDPKITDLALESVRKVLGDDGVAEMPIKMSSEDFANYLLEKPGVFVRLGTRNEEKGIVTLPHNNDFMIDEDALPYGTDFCVQFVLDNMKGIDLSND